MASYRPERIGKMMADAEVQFGEQGTAASEAVLAGEEFECCS